MICVEDEGEEEDDRREECERKRWSISVNYNRCTELLSAHALDFAGESLLSRPHGIRPVGIDIAVWMGLRHLESKLAFVGKQCTSGVDGLPEAADCLSTRSLMDVQSRCLQNSEAFPTAKRSELIHSLKYTYAPSRSAGESKSCIWIIPCGLASPLPWRCPFSGTMRCLCRHHNWVQCERRRFDSYPLGGSKGALSVVPLRHRKLSCLRVAEPS